MEISHFIYAAAHSLAWNAYQVADQRYVVEHQVYRDINDFRTFMAAKRKRVRAKQVFRSSEYLLYYIHPHDQLTYMASYYRGLTLHMQDDKRYQND